MLYNQQLAQRQKKKKIDPEMLSRYITAYIQMKGTYSLHARNGEPLLPAVLAPVQQPRR